MYKNRIENDREKKLKFPLFYHANEEIQQKIEQENSKYICYFEFFLSGFLRSQDIKDREFQKKILSFLPKFFLYFYTYPDINEYAIYTDYFTV